MSIRFSGKGLIRREIVAICLYVFIADMILAIMRPILSLFAQSLGASLTLVGSLSLIVGLTQLGTNVPMGVWSDRRDRKGVLMAGMGFLGLTALCIALTSTPYLLLPTQVLLGLGFVGTITITMAYIADVAALQERSLAIGLAATMMGLGYATGTLLGGVVAGGWGYVSAYLVAAVLALAGFVMAWLGLPDSPPEVRFTERSRPSLGQQFRAMAGNSQILAVSWGGLLMFLVFGGLVITFFPIHAHGLGISQTTLGSMLAVRALASTLARLPGGALATKLPGQWILLAAMVIAAVFVFVLPQLRDPALMTGLLLSEGVAYGLYLTIGQTLITEHADEASRGAALGMYSTATSIGGSLLPFFLGVVADLSGLTTVFYLTGGLLTLGIIFMIRVSLQPQVVSSMLKGGS